MNKNILVTSGSAHRKILQRLLSICPWFSKQTHKNKKTQNHSFFWFSYRKRIAKKGVWYLITFIAHRLFIIMFLKLRESCISKLSFLCILKNHLEKNPFSCFLLIITNLDYTKQTKILMPDLLTCFLPNAQWNKCSVILCTVS